MTHRLNSRFGTGNAALAAMAAALGLSGSAENAFHQLQQRATSRTGDSVSAYDGSGPDGSSPLSIPLEYTPESAEAKLVEYRDEKVAAFEVENETMICLPQAYDLFLKHLVGGLHTVYTKLKRLEITPFVCNVEQVRALRSIGAIQPGVNRCKLISRRDFDVLYEDCASSSSRPGRPPKRSPLFSPPSTGGGNDFFPSKRPKLTPENAVPQGKTSASTATNQILNPMANFVNAAGHFNPNLFPLFPFAHQQMIMTQIPNLFVKQWSESDKSVVDESDGNGESKIDVEESNRSVGSADSAETAAVDAGKLAEDKRDRATGLAAANSTTRYVNGRPSSGDDRNNVVDSDETGGARYGVDSPFVNAFGGQPFHFANAFGGAEAYRRSATAAAMPRADDVPRYSSVQNLLLSVVGLIEAAAATARKQEEQLAKEKLEICKAYEEEKRERTRLEHLLREEQKLKCVYIKRWRHAKRQKAEAQNRESTASEQTRQSMSAAGGADHYAGSNGAQKPSSLVRQSNALPYSAQTQQDARRSSTDRREPQPSSSTKCFATALLDQSSSS